MAKKKEGEGTKLTRSEVISVRLDPKLRFGAELAARKQRRTLSSLIEWAVEYALEHYKIREGSGFDPDSGHDDKGISVAEATRSLWDVDEADRFIKLAFAYPDLLTHEEQILWKLVRENGFVWRGFFNNEGEWNWAPDQRNLIYERLREFWEVFNKAARGVAPSDELPKWNKTKDLENEGSNRSNIEADIPF